MRAGYAYAEGAFLHGAPPEQHWVKETRSIRLWGITIPLMVLIAAWPTKGLSLLALTGYPVMAFRIYQYARKTGFTRRDAQLFGIACMVAKLPQAQGQLRFYWGKLFKQPSQLIEYNLPASTAH